MPWTAATCLGLRVALDDGRGPAHLANWNLNAWPFPVQGWMGPLVKPLPACRPWAQRCGGLSALQSLAAPAGVPTPAWPRQEAVTGHSNHRSYLVLGSGETLGAGRDGPGQEPPVSLLASTGIACSSYLSRSGAGRSLQAPPVWLPAQPPGLLGQAHLLAATGVIPTFGALLRLY